MAAPAQLSPEKQKDLDGELLTYVKQNNPEGLNDIIKVLSKGADPNVKNKEGLTAFMFAILYNQSRVISLLLKGQTRSDGSPGTSAEVEKTNAEGETALILAARYSPKSLSFILQHAKNIKQFVNQQDQDGYSALMRAAEAGDSDRVQLLLDKGAEVDAKNRNGETALILAAKAGKVAVVDLLLARNAHIEVATLQKLPEIIQKEHPQIVKKISDYVKTMERLSDGSSGFSNLKEEVLKGDEKNVHFLLDKVEIDGHDKFKILDSLAHGDLNVAQPEIARLITDHAVKKEVREKIVEDQYKHESKIAFYWSLATSFTIIVPILIYFFRRSKDKISKELDQNIKQVRKKFPKELGLSLPDHPKVFDGAKQPVTVSRVPDITQKPSEGRTLGL